MKTKTINTRTLFIISMLAIAAILVVSYFIADAAWWNHMSN